MAAKISFYQPGNFQYYLFTQSQNEHHFGRIAIYDLGNFLANTTYLKRFTRFHYMDEKKNEFFHSILRISHLGRNIFITQHTTTILHFDPNNSITIFKS